MKVVVVAEFYPRAADPVFGVWAHRQALAARDAGAEVRVLVLHRPVPPKSALAARDPRALLAPLRQPPRAELDGLRITYVPFLAPARGRTYARWGAWAAPTLALALRRLRRRFGFDLVHAHYAVPAGEAVRRAVPRVPLVVSEHGGDVLWLARQGPAGEAAVRRAFGHARLVLANSAGTARRAAALGAARTRVVHLGADPIDPRPVETPPRFVALGHLVPRKRHADAIRALPPGALLDVIGDGPERSALAALAARLEKRVRFRGQVDPDGARAALPGATALVMPSVDEAFGVAYVEALAAGVPAVGLAGEDGPEEIAAAGPGMVLVPPEDPEALGAALTDLAADRERRAALGQAARRTAAEHFSWTACGAATVAAYQEAMG